jgi:hypothetical protein
VLRAYADSVSEVERLVRTAAEEAEEDAFLRLYGAWDPLTPVQVADLLRAFDRPWWIVGGWAVEAASGRRREHEDVAVSMLACDVPALYHHLKADWHVWNNNGGVLHPLTDERPEPSEPVNQLWVRKDATSPWVMDVILIGDRDGQWVSRREPTHVAPVEDVTWVHSDGVRYQRPEIVLLHKAEKARPKDERDLRAAWPHLDEAARRWLLETLARLYPQHAWLALLDSLPAAVTPEDGPAGRPS